MSNAQSTPINSTHIDLTELSRKVTELYEDYQDRKLFNKSREDKTDWERLGKVLGQMESKGSYEQVRSQAVEDCCILESIVEGIMAVAENEQTVTVEMARGLWYQFGRFSEAFYDYIGKADDERAL